MQPPLVDQPANHRAGNRLGHRPARCRPVGRTETAVSFGQDAVRRCHQNAVDPGRTREKGVQRGTQRRGCGGGFNRIAVRPGLTGRTGRTGDRRGREPRGRGMPKQDATVTRTRQRVPDRIPPANAGSAVQGIGFDGQVGDAGLDRRLRRMGTQARRDLRDAQPEVPVGRCPVQATDEHHVGIALGGEIHRPLPHRRW